MRFRLLCVLAAVMAGWGCNVGGDDPYIVNSSSEDVWIGEPDDADAGGELDTDPEPDVDSDSDPDPIPSTGLTLRHGQMEVLQEEIGNGQLRISEHSIEGNQRLCNSGQCIYGRITP